MKHSMKTITTLAMLVAAGILMQLIEAMIPIAVLIPGYKIGLANIAGLYALYAFGPKEMVMVTSLRIVIASLLTGTLFSVAFMLSLLGGIFSMTAMVICKKAGIFSIYGVSVAGAFCHSLGQILGICFIYQSYFMQLLLPVLSALSVLSGLLIAWLTLLLFKRLDKKAYLSAI